MESLMAISSSTSTTTVTKSPGHSLSILKERWTMFRDLLVESSQGFSNFTCSGGRPNGDQHGETYCRTRAECILRFIVCHEIYWSLKKCVRSVQHWGVVGVTYHHTYE